MKTTAFLRRYARDRAPLLVGLPICAGVFSLICYLTGASLSGVLYASLLLLSGFVLYLALDLSRYLRRHKALEGLKKGALTDIDLLGAPQGLIEEDLHALLAQSLRQNADAALLSERRQRERESYAAMWTHQIKTPIAAMRLLLRTETGPSATALTAELIKIEQYVEMSLGYTRLDGPTDFVFRICDLDSLMHKTARRFAPLFIQKKLTLDLQKTSLRVLTDEKWLAFVLEQLLSNAVKYTFHGGVTLRADEEEQVLIVEDTGIGIAAEDLPRVFDHGFTGLNGRQDKRATGLGLYLSKRIVDKLGHRIEIQSSPGQGTRVSLFLATDAIFPE